MSDAMGPLTFGKKEEQIFLGREIAQHQDYSEDTALKIDAEVKRFVMDAYSRATELLSTHKKALLDIADALLAREVLDADQVQQARPRRSAGRPSAGGGAASRRRRSAARPRPRQGASAARAADAEAAHAGIGAHVHQYL